MVIKISDMGPKLDGEFELDFGSLTNRELHTIKKVAGVRAGELSEALGAGDNDLLVALAFCALVRAGRDERGLEDALWDAEAGHIAFKADEEEADALPPAVSAPDRSPGSADETAPSGPTSSSTGVPPASDPSRTGDHGSETSAISAPLTLAN